MSWRSTNIAVVSTTTPQISMTLNGQQFQILWPADHTGWRLQTKTNLADSLWSEIAGSAATNLVPVTMTNSSGYFRLVYP